MLLGSSRQWTTINVNFSRMKVLIQNPENSLYLERLDHWSPNVGDAFDFGNSDNAIQFCAAHGIAPAHVVLQWSGIPYSITIPIAAANGRPTGEKARARKHA
jgi:hypothetical protein